jgi:hypothetical protein
MNLAEMAKENMLVISLTVLLASMAFVYWAAIQLKDCQNLCQQQIDGFNKQYTCFPRTSNNTHYICQEETISDFEGFMKNLTNKR